MKIGIIGYTGFVGKTVFNWLKHSHTVIGIGHDVPDDNEFDVVVNCGGVSLKYLTNVQPGPAMFTEAVILRLIKELKFNKLIHVSTINAGDTSQYGQIKQLTIDCILKAYPNSYILKPAGLIGPGLKKNVVYDICKSLYVYNDLLSEYNFITTHALAMIITKLIDDDTVKYKVINVGASEPISVDAISKLFDKPIENHGDIHEEYHVDIEKLLTFFTPRTSYEYLDEYKQNEL